jgi:hypothetical protein
MKRERLISPWIVGIITAGLLAAIVPYARSQAAKQATIRITQVPPYDPQGGPDKMDTVAGIASADNVTQYKVVVFVRTNTWYVQPYAASPYTSIENDGKWRTDIHLGMEYAALLVRPSYSPPATVNTIPEIGSDVLAIDKKPGRK